MFEVKNKIVENNINEKKEEKINKDINEDNIKEKNKIELDKKEETINKDINEDNKKEIIESKNNKILIKNRFMGIKVKYEII